MAHLAKTHPVRSRRYLQRPASPGGERQDQPLCERKSATLSAPRKNRINGCRPLFAEKARKDGVTRASLPSLLACRAESPRRTALLARARHRIAVDARLVLGAGRAKT